MKTDFYYRDNIKMSKIYVVGVQEAENKRRYGRKNTGRYYGRKCPNLMKGKYTDSRRSQTQRKPQPVKLLKIKTKKKIFEGYLPNKNYTSFMYQIPRSGLANYVV